MNKITNIYSTNVSNDSDKASTLFDYKHLADKETSMVVSIDALLQKINELERQKTQKILQIAQCDEALDFHRKSLAILSGDFKDGGHSHV